MGSKGCNSTSRTGNQSSHGVSCNHNASASSVRSKIWPKPSGTGAGNNKASGHKAKSTNEPLASGRNQLARNRLQRSRKPHRSKNQANVAPINVPQVFSPQSTLDGTRAGKKSCSVSSANDSNDAAATVSVTAGQCRALRRSANTPMKPNGA